MVWMSFIAAPRPTKLQDEKNGFHHVENSEYMYCGFLLDGEREGMGACRHVDGTEYHGEFKAGKFHGLGRFYFTDGSWFEGTFNVGCPAGFGYLMSASGVRYLEYYDGSRSFEDGATPSRKEEEDSEPARVSKIPCLATCRGECYWVGLANLFQGALT